MIVINSEKNVSKDADEPYQMKNDRKHDFENISPYEFLLKKHYGMENKTALSFYGRIYTYSELFKKIDEAERSLRHFGIGTGDIVAVSLPAIPEAVFLVCALSKIGAVYCAFDCRCKETEIKEMLAAFSPKLCIIPTFQMKAFRNVHSTPVIFVAPANALGGVGSVATEFSNIFTGRSFINMLHKNFVSYNDFIRKEALGKNFNAQKNRDGIFGYFYTSGTTYGRKSIILKNSNIVAAAIQLSYMVELKETPQTMLNLMPMFTCYGVTVGTILPLSLGVAVKLVPLMKPKSFKKLILKEKPSFIIGVPAHWEYFVNGSFENCDLSFLDKVIVGGDKMDPEYKKKLNDIFKACNSTAWVCMGYGLSESTSCGTTSLIDTPPESVGRAQCLTDIGIFDIKTNKPMPKGEIGEICISGPTVCGGYYNDEAMTNALLKIHSDGKLWLHSGDLGYMDADGNLYFRERLKRMYVRFDGTKVSPFSIEQELLKCPIVLKCMVIPIRDEDHAQGMCAQALVVVDGNADKKDALVEVKKFIHEKIAVHMQPKEVRIVEKLLYTKNGKLDYFGTINAKIK